MKFVKPQVYVIASSVMVYENVAEYLTSLGVSDWWPNVSSLDILPEFGGRLCYRSFAPGLNPNVTKIRTDNREYIENILEKKHGSVLEHGSITFLLKNVSRVLTHELVRHRAGCAFSQESLRYVRLDNLDFVDPSIFFEPSDSLKQDAIRSYVEQCEHFQGRLISWFIIPDMKFSEKKKLTSWFRRFAPLGLATSILWTANIRALRHIIPLRTSLGAETEIRLVMGMVAEKCKELAPLCFQDMAPENGHWSVDNEKV